MNTMKTLVEPLTGFYYKHIENPSGTNILILFYEHIENPSGTN